MADAKHGGILIAFGGNAMNVPARDEKDGGDPREEFLLAHDAMCPVVDLVEQGFEKILITHGNGPQVGRVFLQQELTHDKYPRQMPLDVCVADTQGRIGNVLQNVFANIVHKRGLKRDCVSVITQVEVDATDPAFAHPTKPIGAYYTEKDMHALVESHGWVMREERGKGFRRVVPSPVPKEVMEKTPLRVLLDHGVVCIAGGGGGIPVVRCDDGSLQGVEAVIDKDRTSALLARAIGLHTLVILTEADQVYLNFKTPEQRGVRTLTLSEADEHMRAGQFPAGSMGPKIEAVCDFIRAGGQDAYIGNLYQLPEVLAGKAGTRITRG